MKDKQNTFCLLMVDDDRDDFFLIQEAFKTFSVKNQLRYLNDGEHLLKYLAREGSFAEDRDWAFPELILLDLNMPLIDGREILAEIKSNSRFAKIPVIVYTTSNNPEDKEKCMELGAHSFEIKPDSFDMIKKFTEKIYNCFLKPA